MNTANECDAKRRFDDKWESIPELGCWIWMASIKTTGYGQFCLEGPMNAHRAAWMLYRGEIPPGIVVRHKCDIRACVNPDHLELGTQADNVKDRQQRHSNPRNAGIQNGRAKLKELDVIAIRQSNLSELKIAKIYGMASSMIYMIRAGKRWTSL